MADEKELKQYILISQFDADNFEKKVNELLSIEHESENFIRYYEPASDIAVNNTIDGYFLYTQGFTLTIEPKQIPKTTRIH